MKLLRFACLFLGAVAVFDGASGAVVRQDNSQVPGIHAIGNGGLCVYGQGADILQLFGPPYSSPGFFTMNLQGDYRVDLQREPRTAVWHSLITDGGAEVARQTDFVTVGSDGFVRRIHAQRPFSYRITVRMEDRYAPYEELITVREDMSAAELKNANRRYRIGIAPGVPFYSSYKAPSGYLYEVFTTGSATLVPGAGGDKSWVLNVTPGDGALYVVAGPNERRLAENSAAIASASPESLQKASAKSWKKYTAKQHRFKASNLSADRRDEFFRAVDDIGVLIKSQQGREGGVLAGIVYFVIDEKMNSVELTDKGHEALSKYFNEEGFFVLPDIGARIAEIEKEEITPEEKAQKRDAVINDYAVKAERVHTVIQLLKAYAMFEKDVEYVVMDNKVKIVDEQTGRILDGRRYSDGLHQAIEAKERVKVEAATQTFATITLQNYFRMYHKLAGMTGTAETEASEFWSIYKLDVVVIPTNRKVIRDDRQDLVYKTKREKYNAVIEEIVKLVEQGRPVLVGTTSVEISELLSRMLKLRGIKHNVLNAKQHQLEAQIVAEAGRSGHVPGAQTGGL